MVSSDDGHRRRRAERMLAAYDRGAPVREVPYPVQAVRFGDVDLTTSGSVAINAQVQASTLTVAGAATSAVLGQAGP